MTTASYMEMMMLCDIIHFSRNIICNVGVRKRRRIISMQGYTLSSRTLRHKINIAYMAALPSHPSATAALPVVAKHDRGTRNFVYVEVWCPLVT